MASAPVQLQPDTGDLRHPAVDHDLGIRLGPSATGRRTTTNQFTMSRPRPLLAESPNRLGAASVPKASAVSYGHHHEDFVRAWCIGDRHRYRVEMWEGPRIVLVPERHIEAGARRSDLDVGGYHSLATAYRGPHRGANTLFRQVRHNDRTGPRRSSCRCPRPQPALGAQGHLDPKAS